MQRVCVSLGVCVCVFVPVFLFSISVNMSTSLSIFFHFSYYHIAYVRVSARAYLVMHAPYICRAIHKNQKYAMMLMDMLVPCNLPLPLSSPPSSLFSSSTPLHCIQ